MKELQPKPNDTPPPPLQEGIDYYIERGFWVFTEHYLRRRGYCCGSGCRHCPYRRPRTDKKQTPK